MRKFSRCGSCGVSAGSWEFLNLRAVCCDPSRLDRVVCYVWPIVPKPWIKDLGKFP